jgi:hypothetical protein
MKHNIKDLTQTLVSFVWQILEHAEISALNPRVNEEDHLK